MKITVTREYDVPSSTLWDILDTAQYGIGYWADSIKATASEVTVSWYEEGQDYGRENWYDAPTEDPEACTFSFEDMLAAMAKIAFGTDDIGLHPTYRAQVAEFFRTLDAGDIDSEDADHIIQVAVFGSAVFG